MSITSFGWMRVGRTSILVVTKHERRKTHPSLFRKTFREMGWTVGVIKGEKALVLSPSLSLPALLRCPCELDSPLFKSSKSVLVPAIQPLCKRKGLFSSLGLRFHLFAQSDSVEVKTGECGALKAALLILECAGITGRRGVLGNAHSDSEGRRRDLRFGISNGRWRQRCWVSDHALSGGEVPKGIEF